jgi:RNA polymerase sigma-B factor
MLEGMRRLGPGDPERQELRRQVIVEHMPYARHLASRYDQGGQQAEDLHQVAYVGLVKAVDRFDPGFGTVFLSFAAPTILGELKRHFRDSSWSVHVPRRIQELCGDVRPATETLQQRLNREPTSAELAEFLGAEPREVLDAIGAAAGARNLLSLDSPLDTDEGPSVVLGELFGADDPAMQDVVDRETLRPLLALLSAREKQILLMSFFREMTQSQIGTELGVSQMQISRLLAAILSGLRRHARCETAS